MQPHLIRNPEALRAAARAAMVDCRDAEAETLLLEAVAAAPGMALAYVDLAQLLQRRGRSDDAMGILDDCARQFPTVGWPLSIKAAILDADHRTDEAILVHEQLVARIPHVSVVWLNYGHALRAVGRTEDALSAYQKAIEHDPASGAAWWARASVRSVRLDAGDVDRLQLALERSTDGFDRVELHFALGRALEDLGRYEQSFHHYTEANRLRAVLITPASAGIDAFVDRNETVFTSALLSERIGGENADEAPIFIVGMPRSGSTLVEQILACHPQVEALGELRHLPELAGELGANAGDWLDTVGSLSHEEMADLGRRYIAIVARYRQTERRFFTDKLPANWQHIGLIHLILPSAKIIDVRREPMACCFANFAFYFNRRTNLAAGLTDLGSYYLAYTRLMRHFATVLPGRVHGVEYEALVSDPEGETRRLLNAVGLPFHSQCLKFDEYRRAVHTPSAEQVRKPIGREANERWRNYQPWLGPLVKPLESRG